MDKIYSRTRIRIPGIHLILSNKNNILKRKLTKVLIILIIAIGFAKFILDSIYPIFETLCKAEAKRIATIISNEETTEVMKNYKYDDLVNISKDNNGNITLVQTNIVPVNKIISEVAVKIQNKLHSNERNNISIRLGSFTGSKILSGRGPEVNVKISSVGEINTDFRSEFKEAGINQTLHRLYLDIKCQVLILTPFENIQDEIENQVVLAEEIIVGTLPNSYYNLEGISNDNLIDIVE